MIVRDGECDEKHSTRDETRKRAHATHLEVTIEKWVQQRQEGGVEMPAAGHRQGQHTYPHTTAGSEKWSKILTDSQSRTPRSDECLRGRPAHRCGRQKARDLTHLKESFSGLQENLRVVNKNRQSQERSKKGSIGISEDANCMVSQGGHGISQRTRGTAGS